MKDKIICITGASSGIGWATAKAFANQGARLILCGRRKEKLDELEEQLRVETVQLIFDVRERKAVFKAFESVASPWKKIDVLVNNAGIMSGAVDFPGTSLEAMNRVIDVNLVAMMIGTRLGIELMHQRGNLGIVLNTASIAAFNPMPADPAYAASKAAIVNFTQSCAPIAASHGVRVMAICPGVTDTAIVPHDAEWLKPALIIDALWRHPTAQWLLWADGDTWIKRMRIRFRVGGLSWRSHPSHLIT